LQSNPVLDELAALSMQHAMAKFVLAYSQLIAAKSMEEYVAGIAALERPRSSIRLFDELGRGISGRVMRGVLAPDLAIAVKLRLAFDADQAVDAVADQALLVEALLLRALEHPCLVRVVALVTQSIPVMLCTELMEHGDLRTFLRACRPGAENPPAKITPSDLAEVASRMATALRHLERNGVIHRDIAARNVLVGATLRDAKLADLGAARDVFRSAEGEYVATSEHNPARWMPLEALRDAKFSHKSDVFSFGVLLWELISYARTPWGAFGVTDMIQALQREERMPRPGLVEAELEDKLYALAARCWHTVPSKRPPPQQLHDELVVLSKVLGVVAVADVSHATECVQFGFAENEGDASRLHLQQPALDTASYVDDAGGDRNASMQPAMASIGFGESGDNAKPALDGSSYVQEHQCEAAKQSPLDGTGYVRDEADAPTAAVDGTGYVRDEAGKPPVSSPRNAGRTAEDFGLVPNPKAADYATVSRAALRAAEQAVRAALTSGNGTQRSDATRAAGFATSSNVGRGSYLEVEGGQETPRGPKADVVTLVSPSSSKGTETVAHDYHLARNEFADDYHIARNESFGHGPSVAEPQDSFRGRTGSVCLGFEEGETEVDDNLIPTRL
jgi:serine/threonine protein kinase